MSETISLHMTIGQDSIVSKIGKAAWVKSIARETQSSGRHVAIKVLPASLSENVDRLDPKAQTMHPLV